MQLGTKTFDYHYADNFSTHDGHSFKCVAGVGLKEEVRVQGKTNEFQLSGYYEKA